MNRTSINYIKSVIALGYALVLFSCSNTKYLKPGQLLYTGAEIKIESDSLSTDKKNELKTALEQNLSPKPNATFLGLRPKLFFYNITKEPKKDKGFRYWMKYKLGQKPVLLQEVDREFNKEIITNYAENQGYFNAKTTYDTISKKKRVKVVYTLKPGAQYIISKVTYQKDSSLINNEIQKIENQSLLKIGQPFNLDVIKSERERIDNGLKEKGFYYFNQDNIIVQVDSTVSRNHKVELNVKLKNNTPELATQQFSINNIIVFPNYSITDVKKGKYQVPMPEDSIKAHADDKFYIIDPSKKFKPIIFDRTLYFDKGDLYNRKNHNLSLNRLINLGVFKFVKNDFVVSDSLQHKFDVYYLLTPKKLQSLGFEVLGNTNSINYAGSEVNVNWTHRNLFRAAEQFKASVYGAFDAQLGGSKDAENIYRVGTNMQLSIPRIVAPFTFHSSSAYVPRTNINLKYEFQNRTTLYTLSSLSASFGYSWKENIKKEHNLKIFDVTYIHPTNVTAKYDSIAQKNTYLQRVVQPQLIFGPTYSYTYTNTMFPKTNTIYYKGSLDLAGNLTGLLMGANYKKDKVKEILGVPFSQYAKIENDFRFYHKFAEKTILATRFFAGAALPFGNSEHIPFSKQFYIGGSNSIRAFRARTLGPGSYDPRLNNQTLSFDQSGDIKLELNAEYRANIYKFFNIAVFADAGNIWLINKDESRPGGEFSKNFLQEIAVGAGVGVRLDFSIFLLRFDLATPLRVPYYEKGERWTFDQINLGNRSWRKDNLILNIAIDYPF